MRGRQDSCYYQQPLAPAEHRCLTAFDRPASRDACAQVLFVTGVLMSVFQLFLFPPVIKVVGIATCQRLGFLVGILSLLAVPAIKALSWNYPSLFAASAVANSFALCSLWVVSIEVQ